MTKYTERCPHCGNIVEGKIKRSTASKVTRNVLKKGGMKTALAAAGSVVPGFGTVAGFLTGTAIDVLWGDKINNAVDGAADLFVDDTIYSFHCPQCAHKWTSNSEETNYDNEEYIDFSSWNEIAAHTLAIIKNVTGCKYEDIHDDSFVCDLCATQAMCTYTKVHLEKTFDVEIPSDFLDNNTVKEIIDAIYDCKNPSVDNEGSEEMEEEESDDIKEMYEIYRFVASMQHYCFNVVYSDSEEDFDCKKLVNRVNHELGTFITAKQIEAKTRIEAHDKLFDILKNHKTDLKHWYNIQYWYNIVKHLPEHGDNHEEYRMRVYYGIYIEDSTEPFGETVIGVNMAGTINVGDNIVICTYDDKHYDARVAWIDKLGTRHQSAESGDTIGMGIELDANIDFNTICDNIYYIYKYDEFYAKSNKSESNGLSSEEQEYIDEYKEIFSEGEISARNQRYLDMLREANGISDERAKELEAMVKNLS